MMRRGALLFVLLAALPAAVPALAQANISFTMGATGLQALPDERWNIGIGVGLILKFDVTEYLRLRLQTGVDKIQRRDVPIGSHTGRESLTMVAFGPGVEAMVGGRDIDAFVSVTPHGTLRTGFRSEDLPDGSVHVGDLTRFSLGVTFGAGTEWFITDNIGVEAQAQYAIFNVDHDEVDPAFRGLRAFLGLQFYLGRNFSR